MDTSRCVDSRYTGIDEFVNEKSIKVYPNPFTNHITIEGLEIGEEIKIYNALGELVYSGMATTPRKKSTSKTESL